MKKLILLILAIVILTSCGIMRDVRAIRSGVLKQGLEMSAFLSAWGEPDRTGIITVGDSEDFIASWNMHGGGFRRGRGTLQEWNYDKLGVRLLFDGEDLVAWKTDKTVSQLKALSK